MDRAWKEPRKDKLIGFRMNGDLLADLETAASLQQMTRNQLITLLMQKEVTRVYNQHPEAFKEAN
jgi:hypothetical protein